jgi:hypothetical protein
MATHVGVGVGGSSLIFKRLMVFQLHFAIRKDLFHFL